LLAHDGPCLEKFSTLLRRCGGENHFSYSQSANKNSSQSLKCALHYGRTLYFRQRKSGF
jgi:hypothetical protein